MDELRVSVQFENYDDWSLVSRGLAPELLVRRAVVDVLVAPETSMLVLPRNLVDLLGLETTDRCLVEHSDGKCEEANLTTLVRISVAGRTAEVPAIVMPDGADPALRHVPLSILDLHADYANQRLMPRPESPHRPFVKLK